MLSISLSFNFSVWVRISDLKKKPFNSLQNDVLDWHKFKAFADDKLNVAKIMNSVFDRIENIVGKGENAGYQHFLLFPQCFEKDFFLRVVKCWD